MKTLHQFVTGYVQINAPVSFDQIKFVVARDFGPPVEDFDLALILTAAIRSGELEVHEGARFKPSPRRPHDDA